MFRMNRQDEVAALLDVRPGEDVLEVGYGPGALTRRLARAATGRLCGVDPSPQMRRMALKHAPRADLRLGTADDTGFGDAEFDCVVSVNNIGIWPSLEAGLDELHRVTRPGGRVVIAWHGGRGSSRLARRLAMTDAQLDSVERELGRRFAAVRRQDLSDLTTFTACRT
jgi:ubiquinone/menaquinone biosynthesis C-methylase UbiE